MDTIVLVTGLALLVGGGFGLVHGASHLAHRLGVPSLLVGITVVAFGTSFPELAVNVSAVLDGDPDLGFGNVVGSNLANLGLILGLAALLSPLAIASTVILREIPMMLLATAVTVALVLDPVLRGEPAVFDRSDGVVLLLLFSVFLYSAAMTAFARKESDALLSRSSDIPFRSLSIFECGALILVGLAALLGGAQLTVFGAVAIAQSLAVPEAVIGLSVVAIGTSLPELVASVVAAARGEGDIAVGNVVGSNIFNLLFVLGVSATVGPIALPAGGFADLGALVVLSTLLLVVAAIKRHIHRLAAGSFLGLWLAYTLWRVSFLP